MQRICILDEHKLGIGIPAELGVISRQYGIVEEGVASCAIEAFFSGAGSTDRDRGARIREA